MFHTLLVPLDGSAFAEQALPHALSIAHRVDAKLEFVRAHVLYDIADPTRGWTRFDPAADAEFRQQEQRYLKELAQRDMGDLSARPTCAVVDGFAADAILRRAQEADADLIVMTTHGRGPVSRVFLGSIADELVRRSAVPVLLVRPQEALANLREKPSLNRVLIPLDRSPTSEQIVETAMQLGSAFGASYTLLHVVHPDELPAPKNEVERAAGLSRTWQEHDAEQSLVYLRGCQKTWK